MTDPADRPVLGREPVRDELELLHAVLCDVLQRASDHVVVVVHAVDRDVATASEPAGRRDEHRLGLGRIEGGGRRVAGCQERQLEEIPAVQRQRLDLPGGNDGADVRADHVHCACAAGDRDLFTHARDLQRDVEIQRVADLEHQSFDTPRRKPRRVDDHVDGPRREVRDRETPCGLRLRDAFQAGAGLQHANPGCDSLFLRIDHATPDGRGPRLLRRGCRRNQQVRAHEDAAHTKEKRSCHKYPA